MTSIQPPKGFSLVELLIALGIIGILATMTVPAILNSQSSPSSVSGKQTAMARSAAFMLLNAFQQYKAAHGDVSTMRSKDLTPYFNYVSIDTTSTIDWAGGGSFNCGGSSTRPCYRLHNGGIFHHWDDGFCASGSDPTGTPFDFDPSGSYDGSTNAAGKSVRFFMYSDGKIRTEGNLLSNTRWNSGSGQTCNYIRSAVPSTDPEWFTGF